jgi:uncharacterized protein
MDLKTFFTENPRFAIAFSGGVDSSYLLHEARMFGCDVKAYFIKSPFQPQFELDDAAKLAYMISVPMAVGALDVLSNPDITQNPADRCYHCKKAVFSRIWELARADGYTVLCDGTNASDDAGERAGMRALDELGVRSPLRESGLTKKQIRKLSCEAGLFTHDKPSYACLATRIPVGTAITDDLLTRVDQAENAMHGLGFSDFRIRWYDGAARIQIPESQFKGVVDKRKKIVDAVSPYFDAVLLELTPRKTEA